MKQGGQTSWKRFYTSSRTQPKTKKEPVIKDIGSLIKRCTCQHTVSQSKFHKSHSNENGEKSPGKSKNSGTSMLNNVSHKVAETKAEAIQTIITSHRAQDTKKCVGYSPRKRASARLTSHVAVGPEYVDKLAIAACDSGAQVRKSLPLR